jgi:hypothetical protein
MELNVASLCWIFGLISVVIIWLVVESVDQKRSMKSVLNRVDDVHTRIGEFEEQQFEMMRTIQDYSEKIDMYKAVMESVLAQETCMTKGIVGLSEKLQEGVQGLAEVVRTKKDVEKLVAEMDKRNELLMNEVKSVKNPFCVDASDPKVVPVNSVKPWDRPIMMNTNNLSPEEIEELGKCLSGHITTTKLTGEMITADKIQPNDIQNL